MKKTMLFVLSFALVAALLAPTASVFAAKGAAEIWDGSRDVAFAGGSGTEEDPFLIASAAQLAYFRDAVKVGASYKGKYVKLCADLYLNDESFAFDPDTGLVKVSDGEHVAYHGTGVVGNDSGSNTTFDEIPSSRYAWYDASGNEIDGYPGELNEWAGIGDNETKRYFEGTFDGNGHTISGMYVDGAYGLFTKIEKATIQNLRLERSLVMSSGPAGGVVGQANMSCTVYNCTYGGVMVGSSKIGGIVGAGPTNISLCKNAATIVASDSVGGIIGFGEGVQRCVNVGDVYGQQQVGGILGKTSYQYLDGGGGSILQCTNLGNVSGIHYVGGICGYYNREIKSCHNTGTVFGSGDYIGGICGNKDVRTKIVQSCNAGNVTGVNYVGGLVGWGCAADSYNQAEVVGAQYVGGISGRGDASGCFNRGSITGVQCVGGLTGSIDTSVSNSYNEGSVTGESIVGGLSGGAGKITGCYNVGTVNILIGDATTAGAVAGGGSGTISYVYYLENCVNIRNESQSNALGTAGESSDTLKEVRACTAQQLKQKETFVNFNFGKVWQITDSYPTLQAIDVHTKTQLADATYRYSESTCTEIGQFYYSCSCGAVLDERFEAGMLQDHVSVDGWQIDESGHGHRCVNCGEEVDCGPHRYEDKDAIRNGNKCELRLHCTVCDYTELVTFPLAEAEQNEQAQSESMMDGVLLFVAGTALGVIGCFGVWAVKKSKKKE